MCWSRCAASTISDPTRSARGGAAWRSRCALRAHRTLTDTEAGELRAPGRWPRSNGPTAPSCAARAMLQIRAGWVARRGGPGGDAPPDATSSPVPSSYVALAATGISRWRRRCRWVTLQGMLERFDDDAHRRAAVLAHAAGPAPATTTSTGTHPARAHPVGWRGVQLLVVHANWTRPGEVAGDQRAVVAAQPRAPAVHRGDARRVRRTRTARLATVHAYVTPAHLLLALLAQTEGAVDQVFTSLVDDREVLRQAALDDPRWSAGVRWRARRTGRRGVPRGGGRAVPDGPTRRQRAPLLPVRPPGGSRRVERGGSRHDRVRRVPAPGRRVDRRGRRSRRRANPPALHPVPGRSRPTRPRRAPPSTGASPRSSPVDRWATAPTAPGRWNRVRGSPTTWR